MSTTLTNGLKLPDKGSVDWYADMQSNYAILDGAVGTVAEHTTQIAGKAPLVHTHTKSDITDLLNSNFISSANNSYDLGSSSYQWKSVYAQSYYYNGTAWGLDKNNEWTGLNTFSSASNCVFSFKFGSSGSYNDIRYYDSNDLNYACLRSKVNELTLGLKYSSASVWYNGASVTINNTGAVQIKSYDGTENWTVNFTPVGVYSTSNNALELGTSTNKWKTLNGINPGALSLPDYNSTAKIDISGSIIPDQYGNIFYTPPINGWLYVCFNLSSATTSDSIFYIQAKDSNVANANFVQTSWCNALTKVEMSTFFPVTANKLFIMQINFSNYTITKAHVIPCLGNV